MVPPVVIKRIFFFFIWSPLEINFRFAGLTGAEPHGMINKYAVAKDIQLIVDKYIGEKFYV
jgi:hypothetical protein